MVTVLGNRHMNQRTMLHILNMTAVDGMELQSIFAVILAKLREISQTAAKWMNIVHHA